MYLRCHPATRHQCLPREKRNFLLIISLPANGAPIQSEQVLTTSNIVTIPITPEGGIAHARKRTIAHGLNERNANSSILDKDAALLRPVVFPLQVMILLANALPSRGVLSCSRRRATPIRAVKEDCRKSGNIEDTNKGYEQEDSKLHETIHQARLWRLNTRLCIHPTMIAQPPPEEGPAAELAVSFHFHTPVSAITTK